MRATRLIVMWSVLALAGTAPPVARRCVDGDGSVSWQSAPCADGRREVAVRGIAEDRDAVAATRATSATSATAPARSGAGPRLRRASPPRRRVDPARARCAAARRDADARRERDWNRLGFVERSRLDADVARACAR